MKSNAKVMVQEDILKLIEQLKETEDEDILVVIGLATKNGQRIEAIEMVQGNAGRCLKIGTQIISSILGQLSDEAYEGGLKQVLTDLIKTPHPSGNSDEAQKKFYN